MSRYWRRERVCVCGRGQYFFEKVSTTETAIVAVKSDIIRWQLANLTEMKDSGW